MDVLDCFIQCYFAIVHQMCGSSLGCQRELGLAAGRGDNFCSELDRAVHRGQPSAATGAQHQDLLARCQGSPLAQGEPGCQINGHVTSSSQRITALRAKKCLRSRREGVFGMAPFVEDRGDPSADLRLGNAFTDCPNNTGDLAARGEWQLVFELVHISDDQGVHKRHARGCHLDQDLTRTRIGYRNIIHSKQFRFAEFPAQQCSHLNSSPVGHHRPAFWLRTPRRRGGVDGDPAMQL